jgi:S-adenosylmethionine-diacylglycerol 3-amino-3-carboxypropyl transferase
MSHAPPSWLTHAAAQPVAFAQVREDPLLDRWVVEQIGPGAGVLLVASGGCTAALLAGATPAGSLCLVDPNPAQLALARLKLRLLQSASPEERLGRLGHAPLPPAERVYLLKPEFAALELSLDSIGSPEIWGALGPDHAGRYEMLFAELRNRLHERTADVEYLLHLRDPEEQAARVDPRTPLGKALDAAFDEVMALDNLIALFGEGATRNRAEPFSRHFARRTRHALATLPAADNPYLHQVLRGCYPDGATAPWLSLPSPTPMPAVTWRQGFMIDALEPHASAFDYVHLSNILDWLSPAEAARTLDLAWKALRPGGWVLVRQLNSTLDVRGAGPRFAWDIDGANALHSRDRSYFYRALHLGRKP